MQDTMAEEMLDPPRFTDNGHEVTLPLRSTVAPAECAWLRDWSIVAGWLGPTGSRWCARHVARS
jgi:hypothetical protein